jgi:hypothetical protein
MDERTMHATDLNFPPKRLLNTQTQAEQNLSKKESQRWILMIRQSR